MNGANIIVVAATHQIFFSHKNLERMLTIIIQCRRRCRRANALLACHIRLSGGAKEICAIASKAYFHIYFFFSFLPIEIASALQ